jgi:hypothetical protein
MSENWGPTYSQSNTAMNAAADLERRSSLHDAERAAYRREIERARAARAGVYQDWSGVGPAAPNENYRIPYGKGPIQREPEPSFGTANYVLVVCLLIALIAGVARFWIGIGAEDGKIYAGSLEPDHTVIVVPMGR